MKRIEKDATDVSFADVADDAICCFFMVLPDTLKDKEFQAWWNHMQNDPESAAQMNKALEDAKAQVVEDCEGFKIVKDE